MIKEEKTGKQLKLLSLKIEILNPTNECNSKLEERIIFSSTLRFSIFLQSPGVKFRRAYVLKQIKHFSFFPAIRTRID